MQFDPKRIYHDKVCIPETKDTISSFKRYSMLGVPRLKNLIEKTKQINNKFSDGIAIECGVANGGSLQILRKYLDDNKHVYGLDSFSNMPSLTNEDENEKRALKLNFKNINNKIVGNVFGSVPKLQDGFKQNNISTQNLHIVKGFFEETIPKIKNDLKDIIILRLDADWYKATYYLLEQLYDKVVDGGLIIIDDFYAYIGCRKAVMTFLSERNLNPTMYHTKESGLQTLTGGSEIYWYK